VKFVKEVPMTIRALLVGVVALGLMGSMGDLSAQVQPGQALGPAAAKRLTIRQGGVILGTLEIPAGVTFSMSISISGQTIPGRMEPSADASRPTFTQGAVEIQGEHRLVLSAGTLSSEIRIPTRNNTTLVVESP
jgi:hypothetical protein